MAINYSVDFYELIGANVNENRKKILQKLNKLRKEVDVKVRTTIPQRIKREAGEVLRKKLGRDPTDLEKNQYLMERTQHKNQTKRDEELVKESVRFRLLNEAGEIFANDENRTQYDGLHNQARRAKCYDHNSGNYGEDIRGGKWFGINDLGVKKWNSLYFCSDFCFKEHVGIDNKVPNENPQPEELHKCVECGQRKQHYKRKNGKLYCSECYEKLFSTGKKSRPGGGKCPGGFCSEVSESSNWHRHPRSGKFYCQTCWNNMDHGDDNPTPDENPLQEEINIAIAEIESALYDEEPKVLPSELESRFRGYRYAFERSLFPQQIHNLKDQVLADIWAKREQKKKNGDTNDPLLGHKAYTIEAINFYLSRKPIVRVDELEVVNQNFLDQVSQVNDESQVDAIASRVLKNIEAVRKNKIKGQSPDTLLAKLRQEAINLIHRELKLESLLSESDISHHNWEEDLKNASEESQIAQIRDSILAELRSKRNALKEEGKIVELVSKGQSVNTFDELAEIISQLKHYRSSDAYQKHETEIEALENKLKGLDSSKYGKQVETDFNNQIKDNGLTKEELKEDTQKAIDRANQTKKLADKKVAEEKISRDGAEKNLNLMVKKGKTYLTKSKPEKEQMAREIELAIKKNRFWQTAYQLNKPQIDRLLSQLRGEQQSQDPNSPKPTWPKALGIGVLIVIPLGLVGSIILLKRKRRRGR